MQRLRHIQSDSYPVAFQVFLARDDWIGEWSGRNSVHGEAFFTPPLARHPIIDYKNAELGLRFGGITHILIVSTLRHE